jgi:hypothetical protein
MEQSWKKELAQLAVWLLAVPALTVGVWKFVDWLIPDPRSDSVVFLVMFPLMLLLEAAGVLLLVKLLDL